MKPIAEKKREILILVVIFALSLPLFTPRVHATDQIKYFAYLRSLFFDRDLQFENEYRHFYEKNPEKYKGFLPFITTITPTGHRLNDATIGCGLLWSPFFALAHLSVRVANLAGGGIPADGYSSPYIFMISLASLLYGFSGLILIYLMLRRHFSPFSSLISIVLIWFGSSLVFYMYLTPPMAHSTSLFIVSLFIFYWERTRGDFSLRRFLILGVLGGLALLIRDLNAVFLSIPLVEGGITLCRTRRANPPQKAGTIIGGLALFLLIAALVFTPQLIIYYILNGSLGPTPFVVKKFSYFPYHFFDVLFSSFHGLFSWTPVVLFSVIGLFILLRRKFELSFPFLTAFFALVYILGCYETWWGGASFGARRFISATPIFAFGLAGLIDSLGKKIPRKLIYIVAALLIIWNFFFIIQYVTGMVPKDEPVSFSKVAYNQLFKVPPKLFDIGYRFLFKRSSFYEGGNG
jgi:hypothetical protein